MTYDFEIDDVSYSVPGIEETCACCHGSGEIVNLDPGGYEAEDLGDLEAYLVDSCDIVCGECHGNGYIVIPDHEHCTDEQRAVLALHVGEQETCDV